MPLTLKQKSVDVRVDDVQQSRQKWRASTGDRGLEELAESIKNNGQIHNISVLEADGTREVINGHRRTASAKLHGIPTLRADVYEFHPENGEDLDLAIARHLYAANLAEPLLPLERARMFDEIMRETGFDVQQVADLFEHETPESINQVLALLGIDENALEIIENNPDRFTETHLRILAEYASPTKHAWRMKPEEQVRMAGEIAQQKDKMAVKDPRKFEKNVRAVVTERRNREKEKRQEENKRRQQSDPVKALFKALEKVDTAITELLELDLSTVKAIEPADKGFVLQRAYTAAEQLGTFADDQLTKLPAAVRRTEEAAAVTTEGDDRRFQINPEPLRIVPERNRRAWQELAREVALDVPEDFRRKWTRAATARVILADPSESYEDLAKELGRTPGAIRYRRQAMIHLLRQEHGAADRVEAYREDPKAHHKHHDYAQIDDLLRELGLYDIPIHEQFELAKPLQQPRAGWRGDGTGAAVSTGGEIRALQAEFRRLMEEARREVEGGDADAAEEDEAA